MIQVVCKKETYLYNAYHMVKAFYPAQEVTSCVEEKASNYITVRLPEGQEISVAGEEGKKQVDKELYQALCTYTGKTLAWGVLMGVRPTKIAMKELEGGMTREAFVPWVMEDTSMSREKAELSWDIAVREKALLDRLDYENGYSLYVGIPFCPSVCTYCSFSSGALSDWQDAVEDYLAALFKEIRAIADMCKGKCLNTIYIGGGTPTTLDADQLERLLTCIEENFSKEHLLEYTVEAGRPDSVTREKLDVLRKHGITRISINPQSMQQKTLDLIGRRHTVADIYEVYALAREVGFDNINMDIIAGLPGETVEDMKDTLQQIEQLSPDNLTVHSLAIKRAAKMGQKDSREYEEVLKERAQSQNANEQMERMIQDASHAATRMGMTPYYLYRQKNMAGNFENVGYAKVDKAGIYNILIMEEKQSIIAAGAGASTKLVFKEPVENPANKKKRTNLIRIENVKAIDAYIDRIDEMIERKGEWLWH